jgi:DNA-directed RNA polymerase beta subunit
MEVDMEEEEEASPFQSKLGNITCRARECTGKPLQVVKAQLPYVFRYLANELYAMNIRMQLTLKDTSS